MSNCFGSIFTLTTFGESHGLAIGGVVDGFPCGITINVDFVQQQLNRRRPGQSSISTPRKEEDQVEFLSGIFQGQSTGAPIAFIVKNQSQHSADYDLLKDIYRPSHADYTYQSKYGIRDHRGGGRASARITLSRVVAGALAQLALESLGILIEGYTQQIGSTVLDQPVETIDFSMVEKHPTRCPDPEKAALMQQQIEACRRVGDSLGGVIGCIIRGVPTGLGQPEFGKLQASLAYAMMGINAAKGFEYGDGFSIVDKRGSEVNDSFTIKNGAIKTTSNHSGGIQGGISNGENIYFRVAFKPTPTILQPQNTVNKSMEPVTHKAVGRHDPCVVPRAVPIVEAMAAMVILDHWLLNKGGLL